MQNHPQHLPGLSKPFTMVAIKGDQFNMGGKSWDNDSLPVHPVEVDDFWMGEYPVTQAIWTAVMGAENNPAYFKGPNRPVENISWDMITNYFLPALNAKTLNSRPAGTAYRLPTEAEWEYAERDSQADFSGSKVLDEVGWYDENSHNETKPVGLKIKNQFGLYDMSGNVWEWCSDRYDSRYYQECLDKGLARNPKGPEKGTLRVLRGGSWFDNAQRCRVSYRSYSTPARRRNDIGFRLVLFTLPV